MKIVIHKYIISQISCIIVHHLCYIDIVKIRSLTCIISQQPVDYLLIGKLVGFMKGWFKRYHKYFAPGIVAVKLSDEYPEQVVGLAWRYSFAMDAQVVFDIKGYTFGIEPYCDIVVIE